MKLEREEWLKRRDSIGRFLIKWHLPLVLLLALVVGYFGPTPGATLNEFDAGGVCFDKTGGDSESESEATCVYDTVTSWCVTLIFLISGVKLKTDEVYSALRSYKASLFGVVSILFLSPCLSLWIVTWQLGQPEFSFGLALFFAQATTLSSGPIIAAQAKANVALALLLTVSTNLLAVLTMPLFVVYSLSLYHYQSTNNATATEPDKDEDIKIDAAPIILQLLFIIVVPLAFGKALRGVQTVRKWTKEKSQALKILSSVLLAVVVWQKISSSADDLHRVKAVSVVLLVFLGVALHVVLLLFNWLISVYVLRLKESETRSVVIVASQKTLPVSITVLDLLDSATVGSKGVVTIPIIAAHFVQIIVDGFLAAHWSSAGAIDEVQEQKRAAQ